MDETPHTATVSHPIVVGVDGSAPSRAARAWADAIAERTGQEVREVRSDDDDPVAALVAAVEADDAGLLVVGARGLGGLRSRLLGSVSKGCLRRCARPVAVVRDDQHLHPPSRIVVGVDGTDHAQLALAHAIDIARAFDAEVVAVHAAGSEVLIAAGLHLKRTFHEQWCRPLAEAGVPHREVLAGGKARDDIDAVARRFEADLIVLGSRREVGSRRPVLGSVTEHLAQHAGPPLLVVR